MKMTLFAAAVALFAIAGPTFAADKAAKKAQKNDPAALFKQLDTNNDSKLSKDEFAKLQEIQQKKKADKAKADQAAAAAAAAADADKKAKKKADKAKQQGQDLFAKLDADKDGFLSLDEFKKLNDVQAEAKKKKVAN